jgi:benzoyl-CoA reductase/2-hydroxyglutaryl-CoA dehydratase subunit BcrC/BadD/HgdB
MNNADLLSECRDIIADTNNRYLEEARDKGDKVIAYTCGYVPEALLSVKGLVPYRATAPGVDSTEMADSYLSNVMCSYSRSLLESVLDYRFEHIDGWVSAYSCDHMRRFYDNLVHIDKPFFSYILDTPNKKNELAIDWYEQDIKKLADKLDISFDLDLNDESIIEAIEERNECNAFLRKIGDLRKSDQPRISGAEYHTLLKTASLIPYPVFKKLSANMLNYFEEKEPVKNTRARILLVGSELDDPEYINAIESCQTVVVADRFANGSLPGLDPIEFDPTNPIHSLARDKLTKIPSPRMANEFGQRVNQIIDIAKEYKADGIIIQRMKFCDIWGHESVSLVNRLKDAGIPVLQLERTYRLTGHGQLQTRVQAFLESMGR